MIQDLDNTIKELLEKKAATDSLLKAAVISFDLPDAEWREGVTELTVNCYLYDIRENRELRTNKPLLQRSADGKKAIRRKPPARIDCAYCITAWSPYDQESVTEEHRLLSQVLEVLLRYPTFPPDILDQANWEHPIPPYPTVIASQDGVKNQPDFWGALDQQLKPFVNYVVTLAMLLDEAPPEIPLVLEQPSPGIDQPPTIVSLEPYSGSRGETLEVVITGKGTHFRPYSEADFDPDEGITVNSKSYMGLTSLTVNITIEDSAPTVSRGVVVKTGREVVTRKDGFQVNAITSLEPSSGSRGETLLDVVITGKGTHFRPYSEVGFHPGGIEVNSITYGGLTSLTVTISIEAEASKGKRDVIVTTGPEVVTRKHGFEVISDG